MTDAMEDMSRQYQSEQERLQGDIEKYKQLLERREKEHKKAK